jgi:predicted RNA-binding protein with PUA-like domain
LGINGYSTQSAMIFVTIRTMKYWLMKSEPSDYSISDLQKDRIEMWDGVRNYQVRNMFRDDMKVGDLALFYHSNSGKETGVVGTMEVVSDSYVDPTQFDMKSDHPDPKSDPDNPRWLCSDVKFLSKFKRLVSLDEIRKQKSLENMRLVQRGNRLSVMTLNRTEYEEIISMSNKSI